MSKLRQKPELLDLLNYVNNVVLAMKKRVYNPTLLLDEVNMPIVRANDPKANDRGHQVSTILGKLCDRELSIRTQRDLMDNLTKLLAGAPFNEDTFKSLGLQCKLFTDEATKLTTLMVHVPKQYVASSIEDNRDDQWVQFDVNRALNLDFHDSEKEDHE